MRYMRSIAYAVPMMLAASPLLAQGEDAAGGSLVALKSNVMFWTLIITLLLFWALSKFAFKPITSAVEAREKSLEEALASAKRDRDEAAALLAQHRAQIDAVRGEAQQVIADARTAAEKLRHDMLEKSRLEQQAAVERGVQEIAREKDRALAELRREAVEMAIAGASRVIEANLDTDKNRKLVEGFLSTLKPAQAVS